MKKPARNKTNVCSVEQSLSFPRKLSVRRMRATENTAANDTEPRKAFQTWVTIHHSFDTLLKEACYYFGLEKSSFVLKDEKNTIWPSSMKITEAVKHDLLKEAVVFLARRGHSTRVFEDDSKLKDLVSDTERENLLSSEKGSSRETIERLWQVFTWWNARLNNFRPFLMSKTHFLGLLKRCRIVPGLISATTVELQLTKLTVPKRTRQFAGQNSLSTPSKHLDFGRFCTALCNLSQKIARQDSTEKQGQEKEEQQKVLFKFVQAYVFPFSQTWSVAQWKSGARDYRSNKRLQVLLKAFLPGFNHLFSFYSEMRMTSARSPRVPAHRLSMKSYDLFCKHFGCTYLVETQHYLTEIFLEALRQEGLMVSPGLESVENDASFVEGVRSFSNNQVLSFHQFLYAVVRIADCSFRHDEFLLDFRETFGSKGFRMLLGEFGMSQIGDLYGKKQPLWKQRQPRCNRPPKKLSRDVFDDVLSIKVFLLLECIISRLSYMEVSNRLNYTKQYGFYDPDVLKCSTKLKHSFGKIYRVLMFDYEAAIQMLSKDAVELASRRRAEAGKRLSLIARKLLYRNRHQTLEFSDMLNLCHSLKETKGTTGAATQLIPQPGIVLKEETTPPKVLHDQLQLVGFRSLGSFRLSSDHSGKQETTNELEEKHEQQQVKGLMAIEDTKDESVPLSGTENPQREILQPGCEAQSPNEQKYMSPGKLPRDDPLAALREGAFFFKRSSSLSTPHRRFFWFNGSSFCWAPFVVGEDMKAILKTQQSKRAMNSGSDRSVLTIDVPVNDQAALKLVKKLCITGLRAVGVGKTRQKKPRAAWFQNIIPGKPTQAHSKKSTRRLKQKAIAGESTWYPFTLHFDRRSVNLETDQASVRDVWVTAAKWLIETVK